MSQRSPFLARTTDGPESDWQTLEDHARGVAEGAARFASAFGSAAWGLLAGWAHDLGKYQPEFQQRLRGAPIQVDHASAGAAWAAQHRLDPLAFVIAGHHGGLPNLRETVPDGPSPLDDRVKSGLAVLRRIASSLPPLPYPVPSGPPACLAGPAGPSRLRQEFWTRFLFSALVDADWLDAEAFASSGAPPARGGFPSIPDLRRRLDSFIDAKVEGLAGPDRETVVNRARARILAACRDAALRPRGIHSLAAPTGGGKTLSSLSFALRHAEHHDLDRVIVVIPYTSIIEQNAAQYARALGVDNVVQHHSSFDPDAGPQPLSGAGRERQQRAAENWDAPVIVTTTVQFFESLFANGPGRCRKLHNIARSVVVLDEVQSLPPGLLVPILDVLDTLVQAYGCSLLLSTATQPALARREAFPGGLVGVRPVLDDAPALFRALGRVGYRWPRPGEPAREWCDLATELAAFPQVLAVVHTRADARSLHRALADACGAEPRHLSALMCPAHRAEVLESIRADLATGRACRVVSTQLVEAGVDLDFPVVYRCLGGLDSIVQAAGRCNREGRQERGRVVLFRAPSRPPPGTPRKALEATESLLAEHGPDLDPEDPDLILRYFRQLYFRERLDARGIQAQREGHNFANVDRLFRMVEDGYQRPLVVRYGDAGTRLRELARSGPGRDAWRRLQPFTVSVPLPWIDEWLRSGAVVDLDGVLAIAPGCESLYDPRVGLAMGGPASRDPESLIA